jgi:pimeloyl-ACP methyl ester carboxylesterase
MLLLTSLAAITLSSLGPCEADKLIRQETRIPVGQTGNEIFLMHIKSPQKNSKGAIVFMHGAGSGSSAIWDIRFRDYSVMRYFACAGFDTYAVDVHGFGGASMPAAMKEATEKNPPLIRAADVQADLQTAIDFAAITSKQEKVDLVAWSWGCVVSGLFTTQNPDRIRRLVLFAPVYDRKNPKRHKTKNAWRTLNHDKVLDYFDEEREEWSVWFEHINAMFRFNNGKTLRLPNGPYRDIYGTEAPIWDANEIKVPTLIIRGDKDRASQADPVQRLYDALENAPQRQLVTVAGANHFLPRERKHHQFKALIHSFLQPPELHVPIRKKSERK